MKNYSHEKYVEKQKKKTSFELSRNAGKCGKIFSKCKKYFITD